MSVRSIQSREQGSRDIRLVSIAILMWASALIYPHVTAQQCMMISALLSGIIILFIITVNARAHHSTRTPSWTHITYTIVVACSATLTMTCVMLTHALYDESNPVHTAVQEHDIEGEFLITIDGPATLSSMRNVACKTDAHITQASLNSLTVNAPTPVTVFFTTQHCTQIEQGVSLRVNATAQQSPFNPQDVWLTVDTMNIEHYSTLGHTIETVRQRFYTYTEHTSQDARILIPGVTLGILGSDALIPHRSSIDTQYAQQLMDECTRAGIIHLTAVSGGHYALIMSACMSICASIRIPYRCISLIQLPCVITLTLILPNAPSVQRAAIMAICTSITHMLGRRTQTLHMVALTVIGSLIIDPSIASDYGFALSCAAVCSIGAVSTRLANQLHHGVPMPVAQALATTLAAYAATLPIQVLMNPECSLTAIPANLLAGPWMDIATMSGLVGCLCATLIPILAPVWITIAAWSTQIIAHIAHLFGTPQATIPWMTGWLGALLIILTEASIIALIITIRWMRHAIQLRHYDTAFTSQTHYRQRIHYWVRDTFTMFDNSTWSTRTTPPSRTMSTTESRLKP